MTAPLVDVDPLADLSEVDPLADVGGADPLADVKPSAYPMSPSDQADFDRMRSWTTLLSDARRASPAKPVGNTLQEWARSKALASLSATKPHPQWGTSATTKEIDEQAAYEMAQVLNQRRTEGRAKRDAAIAAGDPMAEFMPLPGNTPDIDDPEMLDLARQSFGLPGITKANEGPGLAFLRSAIASAKAPVDLAGGLMGPSSPLAAASRASEQGMSKWQQQFAPPTQSEQVAGMAGAVLPSLITAGASAEATALGRMSQAGRFTTGADPMAARLLAEQAAPVMSKWAVPMAAGGSSLGTEIAQTGQALPEMFSGEGAKLGARALAEMLATRGGGSFEPLIDKFKAGVGPTALALGSEGLEGFAAGGAQTALTTGKTTEDILPEAALGGVMEMGGAGAARVGQGMRSQGEIVARAYQNALREQRGLPPLEAPVEPAVAPAGSLPVPEGEVVLPGMVGPAAPAIPGEELNIEVPGDVALGDPTHGIPMLSAAQVADARAPKVAQEESDAAALEAAIEAKQRADAAFDDKVAADTEELRRAQAFDDALMQRNLDMGAKAARALEAEQEAARAADTAALQAAQDAQDAEQQRALDEGAAKARAAEQEAQAAMLADRESLRRAQAARNAEQQRVLDEAGKAKRRADREAARAADIASIQRYEDTRPETGGETAVETRSGGRTRKGEPLPMPAPPPPALPTTPPPGPVQTPPAVAPVATTPPVAPPAPAVEPAAAPPPAAPTPVAEPAVEPAAVTEGTEVQAKLAESEPATETETQATADLLGKFMGEQTPETPALTTPTGEARRPTVIKAPQPAPSTGKLSIGVGTKQAVQIDDIPEKQIQVEPVGRGKPRVYGVAQLPDGKWIQWREGKFGAGRRTGNADGKERRALGQDGQMLETWEGADAKMAKFDSEEAALDNLREQFVPDTMEADAETKQQRAITTEQNIRDRFAKNKIPWSDDPAVRAEAVASHKTMTMQEAEVINELENTLGNLRASVVENEAIRSKPETMPKLPAEVAPAAPKPRGYAEGHLRDLEIDPNQSEGEIMAELGRQRDAGTISDVEYDIVTKAMELDANKAATGNPLTPPVNAPPRNLSRRGAVSGPARGSPADKVLTAISDHIGAALGTPGHLKRAAAQLQAEAGNRANIEQRHSGDDMFSAAASSLVLPSYVANQHKEFAPVKDAASEYSRSVHSDVALVAKGAPELMGLADEARTRVNTVLDAQRKAGEYFTDRQLMDRGLTSDEITAVHQQKQMVEAIRENIKIAAFHKAGFDPASEAEFAAKVEEMHRTKDPKAMAAEALLEEIRAIDAISKPGYTPYRRPEGEFVVFVKDKDGKTIYSTRAKTRAEQKKLASEAIAKYGDAVDKPTITMSEAQDIDVGYQFGASAEQLQRIAQRRGVKPGEMAAFMEKVGPVLTKQGARSGLLHSDDIPGYDPDHVSSVQRTYLASVMAKRGAEFQRVTDTQIAEMSKNGKGELAKYTKSYADEQLAPDSKTAAAIRAGTFFLTSALKPATLLTNLTQPILTHAPEMIDLGAGVETYVRTAAAMANNLGAIPRAMYKAMFDAKADGVVRAIRSMSPTESMIQSYEKRAPEFGGILRKMADRGLLGDNMIELFSKPGEIPQSKRFSAIWSATFAETERVNRMASAKVAFDLYNQKKGSKAWWDHAKERGYRGATEGPEAGRQFVEWAVSRSNFEYGKANRPLAGAGRIGGTTTNAPAIGASLYSMKHYQVSMLGTVIRMLKNLPKDNEARKAAFALFGGMLAAGGLAGLPFLAQAHGVAKAAGLTDKGLQQELDGIHDTVQKHIGQAGADVLTGGTGRAIGSPMAESIGQRAGLQNIVPTANSLTQAAGVPASAVERLLTDAREVYRTQTAGGSADNPNLTKDQAVANLITSTTGFPADAIHRAFKQAKTGDVTTRTGQTVPDASISPVATGLGFTDRRASVMREAQASKREVGQGKENAKAGIIRDITDGIRNPDPTKIKDAMKRLVAHNKASAESKNLPNLITSTEVRASILANYANLEDGPLSIKAIKMAPKQERAKLISLRRWVESETAKSQNNETPDE